jgi:hypothetical protein
MNEKAMTELRTTTDIRNSLQLLHTMAIVTQQINPAIELRSETFRRSVLIRIYFPIKTELELFLAAIGEKGVELGQWAQYETEMR